MRVGTAILAAVFYALFLLAVFAGFTGHISRVNLGKGLSEGAGGLDTLIFRAAREKEVERLLETQRRVVAEAQSVLDAAKRDSYKLSDAFYLELDNLQQVFLPISIAMRSTQYQLTPAFVSRFNATLRSADDEQAAAPKDEEDRATQLSQLLSSPEFLDGVTNEEMDKYASDARAILDKLLERRVALSTANTAWNEAESKQTSSEAALKVEEAKLDALANEQLDLRDRITDANRGVISSFESLGDAMFLILKIPTIILTLVVTVAAGGLGSTVAFTRRVSAKAADVGGAASLIVSVAQGVAAAVAIFLLAGSGMLILTQGVEGTTGNAELSPYLVACIAFVSGFMAEHAFDRISAAGRKLFQDPAKQNS